MIEIKDLKKSYSGTPVLKNVSLKVDDGQIVGIIGRSGAGKTTLLRCLNGIEPYDSGSITVEGREVSEVKSGKELREFKRNIGLIFQHFALMSRKSVYDNIAIPMRLWHYSSSDIDDTVKSLAKTVGLEDHLDSYPRNLSGGQQQRVAIARALTLKPKTLLCDEATSALDPHTTDSILDLLRKINEERGIAVIMVTHQMEVVRRICQKVAVLDQGSVKAFDSTNRIFMHGGSTLDDLFGTREEEGTLPEYGVNIRITYGPDHVYDQFLAQMAQSLGLGFSLIWANTQKYRDDVLGSVIINIRQEDLARFETYLNEHEVNWEKL